MTDEISQIPENLINILPKEFLETLTNHNYNALELYTELSVFFKGKKIEDFAKEHLKILIQDYNERKEKSFIVEDFIEIEKIKYSRPTHESGYSEKYFNRGYNNAVCGYNPDINFTFLKEFNYPPEVQYARDKFAVLFYKVRYLKDYIRGYSFPMMYNYIQNDILDKNETKEAEQDQSEQKRYLNNKQVIILLQELGFLDLDNFKNLTLENKGKLLNYIIGYNEKNCKTYLTNIDVPKNMVSMDKDFVKTETNVEKVKQVLAEIKLIK